MLPDRVARTEQCLLKHVKDLEDTVPPSTVYVVLIQGTIRISLEGA